jgi:hypothetical protein
VFIADGSRYMLEPVREEDTQDSRLRQLREVPWIAQCGQAVAQFLCQFTERCYYDPGQVVCEAGDRGTTPHEDACFLIVGGTVDVVIHAGEGCGEMVVGSSGAGECLGEMMLMTKRPRTATLRAKSHCDALRIHYDDMEVSVRVRVRRYGDMEVRATLPAL